MTNEVIVVSGLPRSGTSLMMQMLAAGGLVVMTDEIRTADTDNPRGYIELGKVKKVKQDASWLPEARGRVFKMISQLLYDLPASENYRIIFMQRDLDEVLASQEKMLARLDQTAAPREAMKRSYQSHLVRLSDWMRGQAHFKTLFVRYSNVVRQPLDEAKRVAAFLERDLNVESMVQAVDPALYRNQSDRVPLNQS
jgi:hypothetical protein